uniref:Leucine-rich repeat-containing protein 37A-like n=1 Tax=Tursiops truncatus TaxID=9739 RepID=A0A6J3QUH5_TURTR
TPDQLSQAPDVPSPPQQEATAQHPESHGEVESSPTQSPELSNVTVVFSPEHPVTTVSPLGQDQAQLLQWPDVTVKPVDLALTVTPAFTNEVETSPPQQETSAQSTVSPEQLEPLSVQQEFSDQHPTPSENVEPSPVQQEAPTQPEELPEETDPSAIQQESSAQHPKPTEWVGPSPVQHQHPTQPLGASTDGAAQPLVHMK